MRPRVGIDAHFLSRLEGNRSYVLALLRALARSGATERFEITVYGFDPSSDAAVVGPGAFRWERLPRSSLLRFGLGIRYVQRRDRLDLWHATFIAPGGRARLVLAVHDALALARPGLLPRGTAAKLRLLLPRSIERARVVLVPTESVKRDLVALGLGERARVAPIGIDTSVFHAVGGSPPDSGASPPGPRETSSSPWAAPTGGSGSTSWSARSPAHGVRRPRSSSSRDRSTRRASPGRT